MTGISNLEGYFQPPSGRTPPGVCFVRVIGYDRQGAVLAFLKKYYHMTRAQGLSLSTGIANPTEPEIQRFYSAVGGEFALSQTLATRHMTVWLGQLRPAQRELLAQAVLESLELLRRQGTNDNIIKNTYVKFMCWFLSPFGRVLTGIGKDAPPKLLFEGDITKYEALFLHLLHRAGCDVVYVNFTSEASYRKADPNLAYSVPLLGDVLESPLVHFTAEEPSSTPKPTPTPAPRPTPTPTPRPTPMTSQRPVGPAPWDGLGNEVLLNVWAGDTPAWEATLLPLAKRGVGKLCGLFTVHLGADERAVYRNRLFQCKRALESSPKKWVLVDQKVSAPSATEALPFRSVEKNAPREVVARALAEKIAPVCGRVQTLLGQRALVRTMALLPEKDSVRYFNYGVRLACWLRRFLDILFDGYRAEHQPTLIFYGPITEAEISLLWALALTGVDVLYFHPDAATDSFREHFLPHDWQELVLGTSLPLEPFPQREERMRASTTAYNASRELDQLLYADTGMFRDRQFARSCPVTLKTTYDEVAQLWKEEAQYRPSFETRDGVVYVPNLFAKISGVDKGDVALYWDLIRSMHTENTYLMTSVPFLTSTGQAMSTAQASSFLHGNKLDPRALKTSGFYRYHHLPDDTQDYILEKIQALMDFDLIIDGGSGLPAVMLSVLTNLDKELLRLLQNFDFTREIPKLLIVDVTEHMFTLAECILLSFLNLVGFDIAIFTPTGYRNLEPHLRPDSYETHVAGEFLFELTVPDLRAKKKVGSGDWLGRFFGGGR